MPKITRKTQQIFASSAGSRQLTAFGTAKNDDPTFSTDPDIIQNNAYNYGWEAAVTADYAPYEEDTNALLYLITRQLAYLYQMGTPEYDEETTYYRGSIVLSPDGSGSWFKSIADENLANPLTDGRYWAAVELGKQGQPLFTKTIQDHVLQGEDSIGWALQGSLVDGTVYQGAFEKLLEQYNAGTSITYRGISCVLTPDYRYIALPEQKNAIDNLFNTTGIADFYILDTSNTNFYLPKNSKFLQFTTNASALNQYQSAGLPAPDITITSTVNTARTTSAGAHTHTAGYAGTHTHTMDSAGGHTHTRGTMNITGSFGRVEDELASGAFSLGTSKSTAAAGSGDHNVNVNFNAANTWSGSTSSAGSHSHTNTSAGSHNHTIDSAGSHTHTVDLGTISAAVTGGLYGLSNTVQPISSLNLLYYLVGATAV